MLYVLGAPKERFCKQDGSRSEGSHKSCLIMVCPVFTYEDMKYLVIHKWNLCNTLVLRLEKYFVLCKQSGSRSGGSRESCLIGVCSVFLLRITCKPVN